jgi:hypothetical protein
MKIRLTKYTHAWIITLIGIAFSANDTILGSFICGLCIGTGLVWAREYGESNCK